MWPCPRVRPLRSPFTARIQQELGPLVKFDYPINDSILTVSQIRGARPSPDGSRVAFTALDRLWVASLPENGDDPEAHPVIRDARRLTESTDVEHAPVWSPRWAPPGLRDLERLGGRRHLARAGGW